MACLQIPLPSSLRRKLMKYQLLKCKMEATPEYNGDINRQWRNDTTRLDNRIIAITDEFSKYK